MEAVDTNILIYAHRAECPEHEAARELLLQLAEGDKAWGIPVFCLGEFLRVVTHARVYEPPSKLELAVSSLEALLEAPSLRVLYPASGYESLLFATIRRGKSKGNAIFDAQIAGVCQQHGVSLFWTNDKAFPKNLGFRVKALSS